jgi:hypothetical protein
MGDRALPIVERRLATASKRAVEAAGGLAACKAETNLSFAQLSRCCATHEPDNLSLRNALRIDRLGRGVEGYPEILSAFAAELGCAVIVLPTVEGGAEGLPLTVCELTRELGDVAGAIGAAFSSTSAGGPKVTPREAEAALAQVADLERVTASLRYQLERLAEQPP